MTPREATSIAEAQRLPQGVPGSAEASPPEQRWIEVGSRDKDGHRLVKDLLVWVVRFVIPGAWIDLLIADTGGALVRVDRSRGYVMRHETTAHVDEEAPQ